MSAVERAEPRIEAGESFSALGEGDARPPVVVHAHVRWSSVWQRPQQTHSRLARDRRVFFVEEPVFGANKPQLVREETPCGVTVLVPDLPDAYADDPAAADALVGRLLIRSGLPQEAAGGWQWLTSPAFEPRLDAFPDASLVVYDCVAELPAGPVVRADLPNLETRLLGRADLVFAGGLELYESRRARHRSVHLVGCGVDAGHFAETVPSELPADLAAIPAPRAIYVGVIDERLDYGLLGDLAERLEKMGGSVVMVGPVARVDPAALPRHPALHYLGPRSYEELPAYLAGAGLCLMPFALNDATRFLNPTKTLEYLASGRPVLSTPIPDVAALFPGLVEAASREAFPNRAATLLSLPHDPAPGRARAERASWDGIVENMDRLGREAMRPGLRPRISRALVEDSAP